FHENSKIGRHHQAPSNEEVRARVVQLHESLPFEGYPIIELPSQPSPVDGSLQSAIVSRVSVRDMISAPLDFKDLASILYCAYGMSRDNKGTTFPRPFRVVPSGGALYPLEIFFYSKVTDGLKAGLYHYNPSKNHLRFILPGDHTR